MALTNIRNEPSRLELEMNQSTGTGRYMLNVPGPCLLYTSPSPRDDR